jgi:hypothetical protein
MPKTYLKSDHFNGGRSPVLGMARVGHSIEELLEAGNAADILGRGTAGAVNEAGIVECRIGGGDILDSYGMPPVVAK